MRTLPVILLALTALGCSDDSTVDPADSSTTTDSAVVDGSPDTSTSDGSTPDGSSPDGSADAMPDGSTPTGPMVDRSDPQLYEHELDPMELDPTVSDSIETQYAQLDTRVEPLGKLVLFLSGATNTPRNWRDHGRQLAGYGFHVVIPHYNNRWSSGGSNPCSGVGGTCSDDVRWEALTGEDVASVIDISRADSAEGRAIVMLEYLVTEHPGGDWGYYLNGDGSLRYEDVVIAGISHGGTSTGLFASRRAFHRAVMHSAGYWRIGDSPATPIGDIFGFSHTDDPQHSGHLDAWDSAGMVGTPTSIDGASPPYGDSRRLISSEPNGYPHCSTAVSSNSPTDSSGNYLFDTAWRHMYGVP
jgi:hypothetical protein